MAARVPLRLAHRLRARSPTVKNLRGGPLSSWRYPSRKSRARRPAFHSALLSSPNQVGGRTGRRHGREAAANQHLGTRRFCGTAHASRRRRYRKPRTFRVHTIIPWAWVYHVFVSLLHLLRNFLCSDLSPLWAADVGDLKGLLSVVWEENYFSRDFGGQLEAELDIHGREKIFTTKLPCEKRTRTALRSATRRTSLLSSAAPKIVADCLL